MKKPNIIVLITLALLMVLTGCDNKPINKREEYKKDLTYSNLVDSASQDEVRQAMESAGISTENIDSFFQDVDSFNNMIEEESLVENGFITIDSLEAEYDFVTMQEMWEAKSLEFLGYNCRITTYDLMKDLISIGKPDTKNADWLIFDENAIENNPKDLFSQSEHEAFQTFYSSIPTENTKDISVHLRKVQEDWKNKEIEFTNKDFE